ncbi:glycoside hydrolase family 88 protein [Draconibacterium sp. IB214405]|uniref:glycoside hydrolase family 88 protein n=1 Tax=Draconibacterium sp. IB214405 TaxID=3097352 RepID=UPI002A109BCE|nr:glycoside hydrolase family 88 protein [Draconibacterium sp. IB214405]MDX8339377.1 glycoside hydrolase family 88 protein [Draconibacterium sp. IB214405]
MKRIFLIISLIVPVCNVVFAQVNDVTTPLHLMQPDYPHAYGAPEINDIEQVLARIYNYLDEVTPAQLVDKNSGAVITDFSAVDQNTIMKPGDFRLNSYEWGVTYAGMLLAAQQTGDEQYSQYVSERLGFLSEALSAFSDFEKNNPGVDYQLYHSLHPHALDDCGAICAAMIKTVNADKAENLDWIIDNYIDYISNKEFRLEDGTLARNRPQPNSIWLDDLFMSIPALAQMGNYTGETKYFEDAVKQVLQFGKRMFNYDKGLFMHGWIQEMEEHPQFHWARANGWAVMTMVELLEVLPTDYPGRDQVLDLLQRHIRGLANYQHGTGFWHQLIDRNDSYLETSATAIYTYSIARAINCGYVDAKVYGPMVCLAWNSVASKVNEKGQVEGTCVGTGMGFDPAFYYYRPVNVFAAHGYGPVLLAGAEMIELVKKHDIRINDSATMLYQESKPKTWKFDFGSGKVQEGFTPITAETIYSKETGLGIIPFGTIQSFKQKKSDNLLSDGLSSAAPFYFQLDVPEGRYKITMVLGSSEEKSAITVKAESRRLMLENIEIEKGEAVTKTIVVDVRFPQINATESIRLKSRELPYKNWDKSLNLEFNGENPSVRSIVIEESNDLPVIFLAGNSTVTDQDYEPWASWGQMVTRFLKPEIVVANFAESGETLKAFRRENRLKKIISGMKPGDYLFMEFAHNDQKPGGNHVEPFTTYQEQLMFFANEARKKGGKPVFVTSTNRRKFDENGKIENTLEEYPDAMRQLAAKENIPLVDLNAMSKSFYEALGVEDSKKAFVHYPANTFPNQKEPLADNTHFNAYGAYELAKCVVQGIIEQKLDLAKYVVDDFGNFDPSQPDPFEGFFWPDSPSVEIAKPDGN